jgi:glutaredoxin
MSFEEIPPDRDILPSLTWTYENSDKQNGQKVQIYYFGLTTCAYCKRGLQWLKERKVAFRWMNLDILPPEKKIPIREWVKKRYVTNMGTPFVIFRINNQDFPSEGFDPDYWQAKIR